MIDEELEYPENHFHVTDGDVEDYMKRKEEEEKEKAARGKKGKRGMTKESPSPVKGRGDDEDEEEEEEGEKEVVYGPVDLETIQAMPRTGAKRQTSSGDDELDEIARIELEYEKDQKMKEIDDLITALGPLLVALEALLASQDAPS